MWARKSRNCGAAGSSGHSGERARAGCHTECVNQRGFGAGASVPATGSSGDSVAGARARRAALGTDCRSGRPGTAAGEGISKRRLKTLLHTWLGAYYAVLLRDRGVDHIHVHHGYLGSWIAMVAARLLAVDFSLTLHGSDLLLNGAYLDAKLKHCRFCLTISEYNWPPYFEKLSRGRSAQNHRVASGGGGAGTGGIAEGLPEAHAASSPCWLWDGCMR